MFDDLSATMQLIIQCCAILLSLFFLVSWYVWYDTEPYAKHTNKRIPVCGHKQFSFGTLSLMHTSYIISSAMQNLVILSFYSKSYCITNIVNFVSILGTWSYYFLCISNILIDYWIALCFLNLFWLHHSHIRIRALFCADNWRAEIKIQAKSYIYNKHSTVIHKKNGATIFDLFYALI